MQAHGTFRDPRCLRTVFPWRLEPCFFIQSTARKNKILLFPHSIISTSSRCEPRRCELVDLLFSLVWVLGDCLISILGHGLNCLVMWTAGLKSFYFRAWKRNWLETVALWCRQTIQLSNVLLPQCRYVSISRFQGLAGRLVQSGRGSFVNATVNSQSYFTNLQVCPASSG